MSAIDVSIVLPCYNPPAQWMENSLSSFSAIQAIIPAAELIIVNDGSSRGFNLTEVQAYFAAYPNVQVVSYTENQGKGYALRQGVQCAKGKLIIYTDIDFPYTHQSLMGIYAALQNGTDVAIGIRGAEYYTHLPRVRVYISKFLRFLIRSFLRIPTDDTQCGLKGFNQKGKAAFLQTTINRYLFDLEFVFLSARQKLNIVTCEVQLRPEIHLSTMNWKILMQEFGNFLKIFVRSIF